MQMINLSKSFQLFLLLSAFGIVNTYAHQRILKGTVYQNGRAASGVHVTVDKSKSSYYTSFDGKYEVKADSKSKWIKFSFPDKETKIELDPNGSDFIDCGVPANEEGLKGSSQAQSKAK